MRKMKKFFAYLVVATMACVMSVQFMPAKASAMLASARIDIYPNTESFDKLATEGTKYDKDTKTLELNNTLITGNSGIALFGASTDTYTVKVTGDSKIVATDDLGIFTQESPSGAGAPKLKIESEGDAKLIIKSASNPVSVVNQLSFESANIELEKDVTSSSGTSTNIQLYDEVFIKNSTIKNIGCLINTKRDINIIDSIVEVREDLSSYGNLYITNSTIELGDSELTERSQFFSKKNTEIKNSKINAKEFYFTTLEDFILDSSTLNVENKISDRYTMTSYSNLVIKNKSIMNISGLDRGFNVGVIKDFMIDQSSKAKFINTNPTLTPAFATQKLFQIDDKRVTTDPEGLKKIGLIKDDEIYSFVNEDGSKFATTVTIADVVETPPVTPATPAPAETPTTPKTGDTTDTYAMIALLGLSAIAMLGVYKYRKALK